MSEAETSPVHEENEPNSACREQENEQKNKQIVDLLIAKLRSQRYPMEDEADEVGLVRLWAYLCSRCNYVWLPKDFDLVLSRKKFKEGQKRFGEDQILNQQYTSIVLQLST